MLLQWSNLKTPSDLQRVLGLLYLEMDDGSLPAERTAFIAELQNNLGWAPRNDLTGGDATDAAMPWSIWEAPPRASGGGPAPADVEALRTSLRDRPGARFLNPVFAPDGDVDRGLFTYGRHVIAALDRMSDVDFVRDYVTRRTAPDAVLRSLLDGLPALSALVLEDFRRCWVLQIPARFDALSVSSDIRSPGRRYAEPSWIQLNVPLSTAEPCDETGMPSDWWLSSSRIEDVAERARTSMAADSTRRPAVAVLDVGFDKVDGLQYEADLWGPTLDKFLGRGSYPTRRPNDSTMHGTRCAAVVACEASKHPSVLEAIKVLPVRVGTGGARVSVEDLELALGLLSAWVQGATVMSLSIQIGSVQPLTSIVLAFADLADVVVVASAGNYQVEGKEHSEFGTSPDIAFPALHPSVLSVGGFNYCRGWANWTTVDGAGNRKTVAARWRGDLDLAGPGQSIQTITTFGGDVGALNGTSYAAPIVAGVAALLRAIHPAAPASAVRDSLRLAPTRGDEKLGGGPLDAAASLGWLDAYMMNHEENDPMPFPPSAPTTRSIDWLSFVAGLTLGLVVGLWILFASGGALRGSPSDAASPGEPHQPEPLAFGDLKSCTNTGLTGTFTATLEVLSGTTYVAAANATMPGTYDYHYDFGNLTNGGKYRIRLTDRNGATIPRGSCGKTEHTFNVSSATFAQRFDLSIP